MKLPKISALALSFILLVIGLSSAEYKNAEEACDALKSAVRSGAEPRSALRDILLTKPEFCPIIRCALEIGIPLKAVRQAARDAALQDDTVTHCSTSTCTQTFKLFQTEEVCKEIKKEVESGRKVGLVVLEKIRKGYQACTVLKCAVAAGGDLDDVIDAAHDANVPDDIISRCCVDGCADPYRVGEKLRQKQKNVPDPPQGQKPFLSPSKF